MAQVPATSPSESGGSRFGPYELLYTLGAGGMGQVFLARHSGEHGIARLVAIKRILSHLSRNKRLVTLFLDEVRIAAQLSHGNIVQVVDHGAIDGTYFMAMEYVHGENLSEVLVRLGDRNERMPLDLLLHVMCCACEGLDHAHNKRGMGGRPLGIVHRDVSPQNVLISFGGQVKIADFGVARAAEQSHQTTFGELRGKLSYMSPEQAYGRELDHRSDLFSLGIVLYEALAGRSPFLRQNPMATLEAVRAAQVARVSLVRSDLPEELVELTHRLLSPDPDERPASAREAHEQLQGVMRLHNMAVSPFDLSDYMGDLFPASRVDGGSDDDDDDDLDDEDVGASGTAVGRRADELVGDEVEDVFGADDVVRRTLFYLKQRHPDAEVTLPPDLPQRPEGPQPPQGPSLRQLVSAPQHTGMVQAPRASGGGWRWALLAALVLGAAGGGVAVLYTRSQSAVSAGLADAASTRAASDTMPVRSKIPTLDVDGRVVTAPRDAGRDAPSAKPRALGRLRISATPAKARVFVDGRLVGSTPLLTRVAIGRRAISVRARGYQPASRTLTITRERLTSARFTLQARRAQLHVTSTHSCTVKVGGREIGATPQVVKLAAGAHVVQCRARADGIFARKRVRLAPGQRSRLALRFGKLAVNLQPWAKVSVDGRSRGTTPLMLTLSAGDHKLVLKNGKRVVRRSVEIRARQTTRVSSW